MSVIQDGASYIIMNVGARTVVDLNGSSSKNGTPVTGWELHMRPYQRNQVWKAQFTEKDAQNFQWLTLTNVEAGTTLDLHEGKAENGTKIEGSQASGGASQEWLALPVRGAKLPIYSLWNRAASSQNDWYAVDLLNGSGQNGAPIGIRQGVKPGENDNSQVWLLIKVDQ